MNRRKFATLSLLSIIMLASLPSACKSETTTPSSTRTFTTTTRITTSTTAATSSLPVTTSTQPPTTPSTVTSSPVTTPAISTTVPTTPPASTTTTAAASTITPPATTRTTPATTVVTTAAPTTTAQIILLPDMLDPKDLVPSYRYYVITKILEGDGAGTTSTYRYEMVRDQPAEHAWKEDGSGKITELFIIIGSNQWTYVAGQGWVKQAPDKSLNPTSIGPQIAAAMKDPGASKASVIKLSQESKNNAYCAHFQIEYTVKMPVLNPSGSGTVDVDAHVAGDLWIAEGLGVPSIIMMWKGNTDYTLQGKKTVIYTEQSLYDIDRLQEIAPPKT